MMLKLYPSNFAADARIYAQILASTSSNPAMGPVLWSRLLLQVGGDLLDGEIGEPLGAVLGIVSGARVVQADKPRKAAQSELAHDHGEGLPLELLIAHLVDSGWSRHCDLLFHHLT